VIDARAAANDTLERFETAKQLLKHLHARVVRFQEFTEEHEQLERIERIELPVARRREREEDANAIRDERDQRVDAHANLLAGVERLQAEIPELDQRHRELKTQRERLKGERRRAQAAANEAAAAFGSARTELARVREAIASARELGPIDEQSVRVAEEDALAASVRLRELQEEAERCQRDLADLRAGRPPRPPRVETFQSLLSEQGIKSEVLADRLEVPEAIAAEAALATGVWAVIIAPADFERAVELAQAEGYDLPIVRTGGNTAPGGVFAGASGLPEALAYLAEVELPLGSPGVNREGLVRGVHWAAFRRPERPALGAAARAEAIAILEGRERELAVALPHGAARAARLERDATARRLGLDSLMLEGDLATRVTEAEAHRADGQAELERFEQEEEQVGPEFGRVESMLDERREELETLSENARRAELRVASESERLARVEAELVQMPLTSEQQALTGDLPGPDVLEHQQRELQTRLERYSDEERSPLAAAQHENQARVVAEVNALLSGQRDDLEELELQLERARRHYEDHIRQTVDHLRRSFREVCEQAGATGEIELRQSLVNPGEFALDIRVAHLPDDQPRSYQDSEHSGGQRAKIALLLLLAAMKSEGAADLLIVDEHSAHLDSENFDYVGELMRSLKGQVQFILALPQNAEARRLAWCDHQIAILKRREGEPFAPPVRLLTKMREDSDRFVETGRLELAG
jgi:chromosome segregation ATPase